MLKKAIAATRTFHHASSRKTTNLLAVLALAVATTLFAGCAQQEVLPENDVDGTIPEEEDTQATTPTDETMPEGEAEATTPTDETPMSEGEMQTLSSIGDLETLVGETVTVSTRVQEVMDMGVFTAYDVESMKGETVLIIGNVESPEPETNVEVTGEVKTLDVAAVEQEYGIDLSPEVEAEYAGQPYLDLMAMEQVD